MSAALPLLLTKLEGKIDDWRRFERKNYNRALGDGDAVPFAPVPFPDSSLPDANPSTPTLLTSLAAIDALEIAELGEYCSRYYPARVYTVSGAGAGLGADGADERERGRAGSAVAGA
ncbi:hypothetical protein DFH08DRAFT_811965 [Mycena albidolilacea]|uniref:Mug135-like C-terminal domain-containing protein n=1 Tax=Mycena albidolilacea TaxID=1033008 RepID=A0AAD7EPK5_9AGAR|nr:hypothetical protein DFH08DRAFT_811965 [Mycena albidolilacea]